MISYEHRRLHIMKELGLQLYTIRDFMQTEEDIRESFRKMRQYGYTQAQTAGCKKWHEVYLSQSQS